MVDIHNHLLYGVDDVSVSVEDSIKVLKDMEMSGYTDIILTPHYINDSRYSNTRSDNLRRLEILKEAVRKNNISINLFLGNEIYIDDDIKELIDKDIVSTLNNTNYVLFELPMSGEYSGYQEIFKYYLSKGFKVVLAHPERYLSFQEDFNKIYELDDMGVYLQGNIDSLVGKYGPQAERMIIRLLKENKLAFLATDIHHKKHNYSKWIEAKNKALKYVSAEVYDTLTRINPSLLVD